MDKAEAEALLFASDGPLAAAEIAAHLPGENDIEAILGELQRACPQIGDVRGLGLMLGMELVDPDGPPDRMGRPPCDPALASRLQRECLRRGLIIELGGRHGSVVRFLPPLIIGPAEVDTVARIVGASLEAAASV